MTPQEYHEARAMLDERRRAHEGALSRIELEEQALFEAYLDYWECVPEMVPETYVNPGLKMSVWLWEHLSW